MEIQSAWKEKRRKDIYVKLKGKYEKYRRKYWDVRRWLRKGGNVPALREELKKKNEELMAAVERLNVLEGDFKRKKEELELSKGMEAQCNDLKNQVDQLQIHLDVCQLQMDTLRGGGCLKAIDVRA